MSDKDSITITGINDLGYFGSHADYAAAQSTCAIDTITIDSSIFNMGSLSTADTLTWTDPTYSAAYGYGNSHVNVNISQEGVKIKEEADLKIGDRSLKDFMDHVADQLAILRPAPELESRWHQLRDLRRQYEECRQDILEKEKILSILKED